MADLEKYEIVLEAIEKGGQTMESLRELIDAKSTRAVSIQFKFINVMKKYPVMDDAKGEIVILGPEEWAAYSKTAKDAKETEKKWTTAPQNKRENLATRLNTKVSRMNAAKRKFDADPASTELKLKNTISICEFHLANNALTKFQEKMCKELSIDLDTYKDIFDLDVAQDEAKAATTPA